MPEPDQTTAPAPEPVRRPFTAWLTEQRRGALNTELTDALAELVEAVQLMGRTGSLTLTIKVIPTKGDHVGVIDDVKVNAPRPDRPESLWFVDADGNLTRNDPNQMPGLRPVDGGRVVDTETGELRNAQ